MTEPLPPGHPDGEPVLLKLGPDWDDPDGVDVATAICLWSPAMGCLLEKLNRTTSWRWRLPFFLIHAHGAPDFGDVPEHLKRSIEAWWDWYERDNESCDCPGTECLQPASHLCHITHEIDREDRIEFLAYDLFDAMVAPGGDYQLKYLPGDDPSSDWRLVSESRLRMLRRCDKNLPESTINLDGTKVYVRVFRARAARSDSVKPERPKTGRGGLPPKYDWEAFHIEITRIALTNGELPDRSELHRRMIEWCIKHWPEQPEDSEIRKRLARLYSTPGIVP